MVSFLSYCVYGIYIWCFFFFPCCIVFALSVFVMCLLGYQGSFFVLVDGERGGGEEGQMGEF